ncbi:MAG: hypothetical protein AAGJ96_08340 [Pseudomonadota bacterium]
MEQAGPFGAGNPAPRLAIANAQLTNTRRAGANHLQLRLADEGGGRLEAIAFRAFDTPLGAELEALAGQRVHVVGRLEIDDWGGRQRAKLRVEDAARVP